MIRYKLGFLGVTVSLDATDPNQSALIQYEGLSDGIEIAQYYLPRQYGAFGHIIGTSTTPIDLDAAMRGAEMQQYRPQIIEGAELVRRYDPGIPKGALT